MGSEGGTGGRIGKEWFVDRIRSKVESLMREQEEEGGLEKRGWTVQR